MLIQLPHIRGILLDIEGTTTSISFVYDVMFPFVREHLGPFLQRNWNSAALRGCLELLAADVGRSDYNSWLGAQTELEQQEQVQQAVVQMMNADAKLTGLKHLQGLIWESGFHSGQLVAHLFTEVAHCIRSWAADGVDVRIYSSGSIAAQKLFFGHTVEGNLLPSLRGHYDTTLGSKQAAESYRKIAGDFRFPPPDILFVSDIITELQAARDAGFNSLLCIRPGNTTVPPDHGFPSVTDFRQISLT